MDDPLEDLEARLATAGQRWREEIPTASVDSRKAASGRGRPWTPLLAAAAVLIAVGVPAAYLTVNDDAHKQDRSVAVDPADDLEEAVKRNPTLTPDEVELATRIAKDKQAPIQGTFVGAVVVPVRLVEPIQNADCPMGRRLLRVRLVWERDAGFDHSAPFTQPGDGPEDGPFKAIELYIDPQAQNVCSQDAQYRSVGARNEETVLYGQRPVDPTGELRIAGARRLPMTASNRHKGYADREAVDELSGSAAFSSPEEALAWQVHSRKTSWKTLTVSVTDSDGARVGFMTFSHSQGGSPVDTGPPGVIDYRSYPTGADLTEERTGGTVELRDGCLGVTDNDHPFAPLAIPNSTSTFDGKTFEFEGGSFTIGERTEFIGVRIDLDRLDHFGIPQACRGLAEGQVVVFNRG